MVEINERVNSSARYKNTKYPAIGFGIVWNTTNDYATSV